MKRTLTFCIAALAMVVSLASCKSSGPEDVSALVTMDGDPAGLVVTYSSEIDNASVNSDTYFVKGYEAAKVFTSTTNPFLEEQAEGEVSYVVILLKKAAEEDPSKVEIITRKSIPDISVRQVKDLKTVKGKKVAAWKDSFKATGSFPINGGLIK